MRTIGERIKDRREDLNMSQEELATKLGYKSRSSVNKIELGINNLTQPKIIAIARVLNTTPAYIMGWEEEDANSEPNTIAAHHEGEDWTPEELDEIERFKAFVKSRRDK